VIRRAAASALPSLLLAALLGACAAQPPPVSAVPPPVAAPAPAPQPPSAQVKNAVDSGVVRSATVDSLGLNPANAGQALAAFAKSCPSVTRRQDRSGLARPADWAEACAAAAGWSVANAPAFFTTYFDTVRVADGRAFATGYYEPEIMGARTPLPNHVPVYRRPPDLIDVALGDFTDSLAGRTVRGRVDGTKLVPYYERGQIYDGALAGKGLEIAWAADPIELFFLQIQGSGRLRMPDGSIMRIGYDGQNGREYVGIGRRLRDMNALAPGQASMDGIIAWLRANPEPGRALMRENKSYVFFREIVGEGPIGALGIAVTPRVTVAADPVFVPLGAPVFLRLEGRETTPGLWIAQDTGGAIKGANRFDTFWGAGAEARTTAGGMSRAGEALILLPKAAAARLTAGGPATRP
jgi:membrane-bound lytic murein transglycosylase A